MKVMILEDDELTAESYSKTMQRIGYEVVLAKTVAEGKSLISEEENIDLFLLDVHLPDGFGFDLVKDAKAKFPKAPMIVITGYVYPEFTEIASRLGIHSVWDKGEFKKEDIKKGNTNQ